MKNRWITLVVALMLCLGLMPTNAQASGTDEYGWWYCQDYETLKQALADPNARMIEI